MDAELPAYLLEIKLRSVKTLFVDESSSLCGVRDEISHAINILERIGESARTANRDHHCNAVQENVNGILEILRDLDDECDMFLLRRAKARFVRGLGKFKKKIEGTVPSAAFERMMTSPHEPLPDRQAPEEWTSIRRQRPLAWGTGDGLIETPNKKTLQKLFSGLIHPRQNTARRDNRVLVLRGKRGEGKTTIIRYVYNRVDVIRDYPCRAWVSIHKNLGYKDVLLELIEQIDKQGVPIDPMKGEDELATELLKLLGKLTVGKYLIVLDDCNPEIWPKLMECLPEREKGRVVITTPETMEKFMGNSGFIEPERPDFVSVIEMEKLEAKSDRWEFLLNLVNKEWIGGSAEQLKDHVQDISPRASVLLAGALKTQRKDHIQRAVEAIIVHIERADEQKLSSRVALQWSYQDLHPLVKACFLFLSIFPKGSEVPLRRLHYLWLSEGFLDNDVTNRDFAPFRVPPKHLARICFGILVNRKLVEVTKWKVDGSPDNCRIPIFVHDFAAETLKSTSLFNVYNQHTTGEAAADEGSHIRRLACLGACAIPRECVHRDLRAYMSFHTKSEGRLNEGINVHLKTLTEKYSYVLLKLLDLEGVSKPKLPDSIGHLLYLKFLGLRSTKLDSLPASIEKLQSLETVDVKGTGVINLPSSLLKSKKLRHLHANQVHLDDFITGPCQSACLPRAGTKGQKSPSNLETLAGLYIRSAIRKSASHLFSNLQKLDVTCDMRNPRGQRCTNRASSIEIREFISGMPNLQSLKLKSTDTAQYCSLNFSRHKNLEKMYLCCKLEQERDQSAHPPACRNESPPHALASRFPKRLRQLTLSMCGLTEDPMKVLCELDCLAVLKLLAESYLGKEMVCKRFPSLRVLKLWKLPQLVTLKVREGSMACLEEMEIRNCPRMEELEGSDNIRGSIDVLVLDNMSQQFEEYIKSCPIYQKTTFVKTPT